MKKIISIIALLAIFSPLAQAQVTFDSGSAHPNNPDAARQAVTQKSQARQNVLACAAVMEKSAIKAIASVKDMAA